MERIIRPFDQYRPEEQLLADSRVDSGHILATGSAIRNRRWAHGLWLVSTAISSILVLIAFVTPSVITVSAQAVTDGRMVRQEERMESVITSLATMNAENKVQHERITRLEGAVAGDENIIKFGGAIVVIVNVVAAWFSRKKT